MILSFREPNGSVQGVNLDRLSTFRYTPNYAAGPGATDPVTPLLGLDLDTGEQIQLQGPIARRVLGLITNGQDGVLVSRAHNFTLEPDESVEFIGGF